MNSSLIVALGGFTTPTRKTYVLFCRDNFDYAELEEHPHLCNHLGKHFSIISEQIIYIFSYMFPCDYTNQYFLAPKLKGRPRKRKPRQTTGVGSPAESEASSESSTSTSMSISAPKVNYKKFVLEVTSLIFL